jgi:hypothetical protein
MNRMMARIGKYAISLFSMCLVEERYDQPFSLSNTLQATGQVAAPAVQSQVVGGIGGVSAERASSNCTRHRAECEQPPDDH